MLLVSMVFIWMATMTASSVFGCYAVVVGKEASADGSVLLGHDEQNGGRRFVNLRVIPSLEHPPGTEVTLEHGGTLPEVSETYSFIWSENLGLSFSDAYINEWGVAVVSDGCPTREDSYSALVTRGDIVEGGIGYMLRRLIVQRAKTAREGVHVAGDLLDRFGYWDSGRTLVIADPNEAWLLSIVRGKHWVAQRVPDDEVALLPNVHIISEIDLNDPDHFMGPPDIVDYAIKRGWFDPENSKSFRFSAAYNQSGSAPWDPRQERGRYLVTGHPPDPSAGPLPFSVKPDHPLTVKDVITILRDDAISNIYTQEGAVFQLRSELPPEIGCIYWRTSGEPRTGLLVPWYVGITETPASYYKPVDVHEQLTLSYHFNPSAETFNHDPEMAWWAFKGLQDLVHTDYQAFIEVVRPVWDEFEARAFNRQPAVEQEALGLYSEDPDAARSYLMNYSKSLALQAVDLTNQMADALTTGGPVPTAVRTVKRPTDFRLSQNVPNAFNAQTTIIYEIAQAGPVQLSIYTVTGQLIRTLVNGDRSAGAYSVVWEGRDHRGWHVASGIYVCRLVAGDYRAMRKLALVR